MNKTLAAIVLSAMLVFPAYPKPKFHFPYDPWVVYTPAPEGKIWYCELKSWGGARCSAVDKVILAMVMRDANQSLVCIHERGFTETCWRSGDVDDKNRYSY